MKTRIFNRRWTRINADEKEAGHEFHEGARILENGVATVQWRARIYAKSMKLWTDPFSISFFLDTSGLKVFVFNPLIAIRVCELAIV